MTHPTEKHEIIERGTGLVQDYMNMRHDDIWEERSTKQSVSFTSSLTEAQMEGNV